MKNSLIISFILICDICLCQINPNVEFFETKCDSIYNKKGYKIVQQYFPNGIDTIKNNNTVFQFFFETKANSQMIFHDTIFSSTGEIVFKDFNHDGIKDILIQNISDVRSNWTYNLYLVDTIKNKLKKVQGFEKIKNPNYLPNYDLIDNYVNSGQNWTSFYKIKNDTVIDYGFVIYDNDSETTGTYDTQYRKTIKKILKKEKTSR